MNKPKTLIVLTILALASTAASAQTNSTDAYSPPADYPSDAADVAADPAGEPGDDQDVTPRDIHRCVHKLDKAFHHAHREAQHIKQQMRAIEHRVTMLEIHEMRLSNALEDIVVGEPINETQAAYLEKVIARAEHALEGDISDEKAAYLKMVIARAQSALDAGVWTQDDVDALEERLERIQKLQDRLLHKYLGLKAQLAGLRERFTDFASDQPCKPDVKPTVQPDAKPMPAVASDKSAPDARPATSLANARAEG